MIRTITLLAFASFAATVPVSAATYSVNFTGIVSQTQGTTGQAIGNTVTGRFDLDDLSRSFLDFTIAGQSVASGFSSSATIVPALTDAIYMAQVTPVSTGGSVNSTFTLDLSSLTTWPASETPFSLLTDTAQLASNLDAVNRTGSTFPSTFSYYTGNANGTNVVSLTANLTSITAAATAPEPATFALLGSSLVVLGLWARRRRA